MTATGLGMIGQVYAHAEAPLSGPYADGLDPEITWELVDGLSDEFEAQQVDERKWQLEPKANGWNWIGRPPGLFLPENVMLEDGKMKVTVGKLDEPQTINGKVFRYQGAIVRSKAAGESGWYYECKMKANATEMSSTFWLMTKGPTNKKLEMDIETYDWNSVPDVNSRVEHASLPDRQTQYEWVRVWKPVLKP